MSQENIRIDDKGAKIIARAIYADIIEYIQTHKEEYQEFLSEINKGGQTEDEATH